MAPLRPTCLGLATQILTNISSLCVTMSGLGLITTRLQVAVLSL